MSPLPFFPFPSFSTDLPTPSKVINCFPDAWNTRTQWQLSRTPFYITQLPQHLQLPQYPPKKQKPPLPQLPNNNPNYPNNTLGPRPAAALRGLTVRLGVHQEYCSCHLWRPPTEIITSDSLAGKLRVWAVMTDGHAASFLGPDESTGALQRANRECV